MDHGGRKAIIAAFLANVGIAIAKFVAFMVTGSASLGAEAIHSLADTFNQALLFLGERRSRRRPSPAHPFGYGGESYFWSFMVAIVLFSGGGLFALFEAIEKLRTPHEIDSVGWAIGVLVLAMVFESLSLRTGMRESLPYKRGLSWWQFIRRSKRAELPVVILEDTGALIGLVFALVGVSLATITNNSRFDAIGSVAIGLLLVAIAITLAVEMKSLLIGESADESQVDAIHNTVQNDENVQRVADLRTLQLSPEKILVTVQISLHEPREALSTIERVNRAIADVAPNAVIYLQPIRDERDLQDNHPESTQMNAASD